MLSRVAALVGMQNVGKTVAAAVVLVVLAGAGVSIALASNGDGWNLGLAGDVQPVATVQDRDGDGLADALENRIGSDPDDDTTLGNVNDGWLYHWYGTAIDWNRTSILDTAVLVPPTLSLPEPLRSPGGIDLPTIASLYATESAWRDGHWWLEGGLDPHAWDGDQDGIADAWLIMHGFDPITTDPDDPATGDVGMTIGQKYQHGLDPRAIDSDADGLSDADEIAGSALLAGQRRTFNATDPLRFSSRGDGIADGFIVRFDLDPGASDIAKRIHTPGGLTVRQAYVATRDHCDETGPCDWAQRLDQGPLVDPTAWDSLGDGVPDAWALLDPNAVAHPLVDARTQVISDTKAWDAVVWNGDAITPWGRFPGDGSEVFEMTVLDAYMFLRPTHWDEAIDGPWWGGLPTQIDSPPGALPPAVALRGWSLAADASVGRGTGVLQNPDDVVSVEATANPLLADTDGDGLTDIQEYYGISPDGHVTHRTNPASPDTDNDGLTDCQEIRHTNKTECESAGFAGTHDGGFGTHPRYRDSSGSFLTDGEESTHWSRALETARADLNELTPQELADKYGWLRRSGENTFTPDMLERLGPLGSILGETPNILHADSDEDSLPNGWEVRPNKYLPSPTDKPRPATDPGKRDTDGDGLPDPWEIGWSRHRDYSESINGWPLDPTKKKSVPDSPADSDLDTNLAGDEVTVAHGTPPRAFTNRDAYLYGLNPYKPDSTNDGISDVFAIHWGVEAVPAFAIQVIESDPASFGPMLDAQGKLGTQILTRGGGRTIHPVVIDPTRDDTQAIGTDSSLLGIFGDRHKGTWIARPDLTYSSNDGDPVCETDALPADTTGAWQSRHEGDLDGIPSRAGLQASCWVWAAYPLAADIQNHTNPWSHDFDDDGLPDAWDLRYGDPDPADRTEGSRSPTDVLRSCQNPSLTQGLPSPAESDDPRKLDKSTHCLTYEESYLLGIDPLASDTDGGGLVDWFEIAIGLDPLKKSDDRGEEDWSGNGIINSIEDAIGTNRLLPDFDRDGLVDGDIAGVGGPSGTRPAFLHPKKGNGDLCLKRGDDTVENMPHRPGGPLNRSELVDLYISAGILHDDDPGDACSDLDEGYILFKREGHLDVDSNPPTIFGSGQGTDPLAWDTSADGLPDGWVVYWRDTNAQRGGKNLGLDPHQSISDEDSDGDVPTSFEYTWARPDDWDETRDGPWWSGLDPTTPDTDGDLAWFQNRFHALDSTVDGTGDDDNDNDGIPDIIDAYPGLDHDNQGIVSWNVTTGRYETEYALLWAALKDRTASSFLDRDSDRVPDFLDRARVKVVDVDIRQGQQAVTGLSKQATDYRIAGRVMVDEAPVGATYMDQGDPGAADGVGGATVKAVLVDSNGKQALLGAGFTGPDGAFDIAAGVIDQVATGQAPECRSPAPCAFWVDGRVVLPGGSVTLPGGGNTLQPGPVQLHILVEPNEPNIQTLCFETPSGCVDEVTAYKDTPYALPRHASGGVQKTLAASVIHIDGDRPDPGPEHVRHGAAAIFASVSSATELSLTAPTQINLSPQEGKLLVGETLHVRGNLADTSGTPIAGTITASFPGQSDMESTTTDGSFQFEFATIDLEPAAYTIGFEAEVLGSYLDDPAPMEETWVVSRDTRWTDTSIDGTTYQFTRFVDASRPVPVAARLVDHNGHPQELQAAAMRIVTPDQGVIWQETVGQTNETGWIQASTPILAEVAPLATIRLDLMVVPTGEPGTSKAAEFGLKPRFPTTVETSDVVADVGEAAVLSGTLLRASPQGLVPVGGADLRFEMTSKTGETMTVTGADAAGRFDFPVIRDTAQHVSWQMRFVGAGNDPASPGQLLLPSASTPLNVTHESDVVLDVDAASGVRGQPLTLKGELRMPDGEPLGGRQVHAAWSGGESIAATTDDEGGFHVLLVAKQTEGIHKAEAWFTGEPALRPRLQQTSIPVRIPVAINLTAENMTLAPDGTSDKTIHGVLHDENNAVLRGRAVSVVLQSPGGNTTLDRVTGPDGSFEVRMSDAEPVFGAWNVTASYAGDTLETPAVASVDLIVRHEVALRITRAPAELTPGTFVTISGRMDAPAQSQTPVQMKAYLGDALLGHTVAPVGSSWSIPFTTPLLQHGSHELRVEGTAGPMHTVEGDNTTTTLLSHIRILITQSTGPGGERIFDVHATTQDGDPVQDLEMVLARHGNESGLGLHHIRTGATGRYTLQLDASDQGDLTVVALRNPLLRVGEVQYETATITAPTQSSSVWMWVVGASVAIVAAIVTAFVWWRRHHRNAIGAVLSDAYEDMLRPDASPAEVIRHAYRRLLVALAGAGYTPADEATARDIAAQATKTFQLTPEPMSRLTTLFEIATYTRREMHPRERATALRALRELTRDLREGDAA